MTRPKLKRDDQQWMLDWIVKTTGRVQNLANDERDVPPVVKSYRMIPRVLYKEAKHIEGIAKAAEAAGHTDTARQLYRRAQTVYHDAQHSIFEDDNKEKIFLHGKHIECADKVAAYADYPVEKVEIPWEGAQIQGRFHVLKDRRKAPAVLFLPGMDMTKEAFPNPLANPVRRRGLPVLRIDGPGQGISNSRKIRVTADNSERAAMTAIDWLVARPEVDPTQIVISGISFGCHWGVRAAANDKRVRALATTYAVVGPKKAIFGEASPRFKQMFMYMAGHTDEAEFDAMAERMDTAGFAERITCPTLLTMGEYDPLCHLEAAEDFFRELRCPKELWVLENEFHRISLRQGIGGIEIFPYIADWVRDELDGKHPKTLNKTVLVKQKSSLGPYEEPIDHLDIPR